MAPEELLEDELEELDEELLDELEDELDDELLLEELDEVGLALQNALPKIKLPVTSSRHPGSPRKQTGVNPLLQIAT